MGLILQPSVGVLASSREGAQHFKECVLVIHRLTAWSLPYSPAALHHRKALAHLFHGGFRRRNLVAWQSFSSNICVRPSGSN